ncbi:MAG: hypothetical protein H6712_33035 [Myxococcales bacterium]|nr:hypothetical protein [Myxococcales bacterium]MCB9718718.1 hypothetical protein [Myxococcales bacterium]
MHPRPRRPVRELRSLAGVGLGLWLAACSGAPAEDLNSTGDEGPVEVPPWACVPGETQPCACPEELEGLRTCAADGSAFGECDCSPGAVSQGPLPTGSESGTGDSGSGTAEDSGSGTGGATSMGSTTDPDPTTSGGSNGSTGPGGSSGSSTG